MKSHAPIKFPNISAWKNRYFSFNIGTRKVLFPIIFFILDLLSIFSSALISFLGRFDLNFNANLEVAKQYNVDSHSVLFLISLLWVLVLAFTGTYRYSHSNLANSNFAMVFRRSIRFFFALGFLSFMTKASFSRGIFFLMLILGLFFIFINRMIVQFLIFNFLFERKRLITPLFIVGKSSKEIEKYSDWIINNRKLGFKVSGRITCNQIDFDWVNQFDAKTQRESDFEVLLLPGIETDANFAKFLHYLEDFGIHVNWIPLNSGNFGYWLIPSPQEGSPFLTFRSSDINFFQKSLKRMFDILFSLSAILLLIPIYSVISVMILLKDGWPILFIQSRIGQGGKSFKFLKFRTMVLDAERMVGSVSNMHAGQHILFKNALDPRVTKLGRFLRRYSLDELPQFINVLIGSMSVVGPRPALPKEVTGYDSIYERRLIAKPGITGPWQISGRSDLDLQTSVSLDLNYLSNWSFAKDLLIIASTVSAVFKGKGAY